MFAPVGGMRYPSFAAVQRAYIWTAAVVLTSAAAGAQSPGTPAIAPDVQQTLAVQVALDRAGFSPGEIDGRSGTKTRLALEAFQQASNLAASGTVTEETLAALGGSPEPVVNYTITQQDVAGPFIEKMPRDMMAASKLSAFGYTSALEGLGEKFHSSPTLLQKLNPGATWTAGAVIRVPNVEPFELPVKNDKPAANAKSAQGAAAPAAAAKPPVPTVEVIVSGATKSLTVRDAGRVVMYAPITIGSARDPLPIGEWKVLGVSWNPVFNYNPDLFWDADPKHAKAKIAAGPNNPVGVAWVDINKEHFGLHGTPEPAAIGRTESHGCIRLTNWDATRLGRLVSPGVKVTIQ